MNDTPMTLTEIITMLVQARPDLKGKMPQWCGCNKTCRAWSKGPDVVTTDIATLIVQGIVAEELARNGWCICRVTPPDYWMLSDAWYNPRVPMRPSPWLGMASTYLEAATRALCEIARKA